MRRIIIASILALVLSVAFVPTPNAQMAEKGWEKTVTLPSGEVILDMSGEWDILYDFYGQFGWILPVSDILTITQEGNRFTAVKQIGSQWVPKGTETIKGELGKDGFKAVYIYRGDGFGEYYWTLCKEWEISKNGNKLVVDEGKVVRATLNRR